MEYTIRTAKNENICIKLDMADNGDKNKLAFICHGITGYKEQDVILQSVATLQSQGYNVISFDCRNSRGKSFNNQQCATLTDFCDDLRCVINWAKHEDFYTAPFLLAGHSLGGAAVLDYAINNSEQISSIILISSVFSGNDLLKNTETFAPEFLQLLKDGGIIRTRKDVKCYLDFSYLQNAQQYDFYDKIKNFSKPILLVTSDKDTASLPQNNEDFYKQIKAYKEIHILKNCSHIYDTKENQKDLHNAINGFVAKIS